MRFEYLLMLVIAGIGMLVQWRLQSVFTKFSRVPFAGGLTGREVAERMLHAHGITDVKVISTPGHLTDHFDPRNKTVNLSEPVYNSNSVSAAAVAAHECGHAVQHAVGYAPLKMRSALVPLIQISSQWAMWVVIAGIMLLSVFPALYWIGVAMIAGAAVFALVTLPVEFNASNRAMAWLTNSGTLHGEEVFQARTALNWAACTYLVAALSAVATLLYVLGFRRN
jgi:Zn-dependent membrane protease YugP